MIALATAHRLKKAGLVWVPALHDFFAVPDRGLDDKVFVLTDVTAYVEMRNNLPMVTFHGTAEWALDYLLTSEVIWLPREDQLRMEVMRSLSDRSSPSLELAGTPSGYTCRLQDQGNEVQFASSEASEAYAAALLYLLTTI